MNSPDAYPDHQRWQDGSRQELIPEIRVTFWDAIKFMRSSFKQYGHAGVPGIFAIYAIRFLIQ
ncbi:hypothetical protein [Dyadobacter sp. CY347]|uniref:hypothetical protein n=1 Tax=Dyadobacter sp. CY347 TaxID=2909336 RepID=UPI001F245CB9|nr:hypothetical protein [Dyadobacter sp. CY347]MCF2490760.1 hypothetical protein [Dyadobacter sp. CY347]